MATSLDSRREALDVESLQISKDDLFKVVDALIHRWSKNRKANYAVIAGAHAFKLGVRAVGDDKFAELWAEMVRFSNEMLAYNEMKRLKGEYPKASEFADLFVARFEHERQVEG